METLGGERRYSSYSFSTSALDRGEWSASRPGRALPRGKDPQYPLDRRLGGPQSRSGHRGKILCPRRGSNPDRPVVQPVVRHYTAWATPAPPYTFTPRFLLSKYQALLWCLHNSTGFDLISIKCYTGGSIRLYHASYKDSALLPICEQGVRTRRPRFLFRFRCDIWKQERTRCDDMWVHVYRYFDTSVSIV
jgi:hypothetical protein